jgi:hypothetical protein
MLLLVMLGYITIGNLWLLYWWILLVILLMVIGGYSIGLVVIGDYYIMAIGAYFIGGY